MIYIFLALLVAAQGAVSRTNYASALLGAQLVASHSDAKGTHNVLNDDKEKYMIVPCKSPKKSFTVQLSRDIEVASVSTSNGEFFSSSVKNFTLLGSRSWPCRRPDCLWRVLGHFQANFSRDVQHFLVAPQEPIRYVRFLWVSTHGNQQSCTMTSFGVFGSDVLDSLTADLDDDTANNTATDVVFSSFIVRNTSRNFCDAIEQADEESFALARCPARSRKPQKPPQFSVHSLGRQIRSAQKELHAVHQQLQNLSNHSSFLSSSLRGNEIRFQHLEGQFTVLTDSVVATQSSVNVLSSKMELLTLAVGAALSVSCCIALVAVCIATASYRRSL